MNDTTITYNPYEQIPFNGYRSDAQPLGERFLSLMHFIESEKFRGVDERYRSYLLTLDDPIDFRLETAGVAQCQRRTDWDDVKGSLIRAGMWMQLVQHQETLRDQLLRPDCSTGIQLIDDAANAIYTRLVAANSEPDQLRRVVITGDTTSHASAIFDLLNQIFSSRLPDELYVADEGGVALLAQKYALNHYFPIRIFAGASPDELATQALERATHVFSIGAGECPDSEFAVAVLARASEQGKTSHHISLKP